ncbi:hypothetical protein TBLA_0D01810 [Henningerozyma blattae CBS 6284]|uniref:Inosine/uridine-preferring nucleoside hydrolase domain-containing protein n=1 Tax=Henningerozyma blattae (strain ATCC 34711 / CBS 6284 / DSM 70876 / NBRC 10599 / NRRL Y-10934 / UCD 77-7) TaxID=1071380 RepID=I2H2T7_HENB6|nr:hypothetical protein TBLA_0D01810 [Tetrapisispora blattae CBS 6284]CCH60689.1 hypothetical protein TBLA_0D01810 [Tetrapisispora blattae CBS 6284]
MTETTPAAQLQIPIWLDCDPGHDDAVAMLLSCFHPAFELLGISASYGNAPIERTEYNARSLITCFNKYNCGFEVYQGATRPWVRLPHYAPGIHGETGLDGTDLLPEPQFELSSVSYLDAIEEKINHCHSKGLAFNFVCTGPTTGIATLLKERPYLIDKISYISIMGGGFHGVGNANIHLSAEFNVWCDPHSANFLFTDPAISKKCIWIPLNLTHKAIATKSIVHDLFDAPMKRGTTIKPLMKDLFAYFGKAYKNQEGFQNGPPIHDPLALLPLLDFYGDSSTINFIYKRLDVIVNYSSENDPDLGKCSIVNEYARDSSLGVIVGVGLNFTRFWNDIKICVEYCEANQ